MPDAAHPGPTATQSIRVSTMVTANDVFRAIASDEKAKLTPGRIARRLGIDEADGPAMAHLGRLLEDLKSSESVHIWKSSKGRTLVTLSSVAAYRLRLELNESSSRWVARGAEQEKDYAIPEVTDDGALIICETNLTEVPPGALSRVPDRRTEVVSDPDFGLQRILADERRMGLIRPTLPLVGVRPWTAENWERSPDAHVCDPLDDPRRSAEPGDDRRRRRMTPEKLRAARPDGPCPVCNDRVLRAMVSLSPMKIGKNRAPRPPAVVDGGEFCCRCGRSFQESIWPRVFKITDSDVNGKPCQ